MFYAIAELLNIVMAAWHAVVTKLLHCYSMDIPGNKKWSMSAAYLYLHNVSVALTKG